MWGWGRGRSRFTLGYEEWTNLRCLGGLCRCRSRCQAAKRWPEVPAAETCAVSFTNPLRPPRVHIEVLVHRLPFETIVRLSHFQPITIRVSVTAENINTASCLLAVGGRLDITTHCSRSQRWMDRVLSLELGKCWNILDVYFTPKASLPFHWPQDSLMHLSSSY